MRKGANLHSRLPRSLAYTWPTIHVSRQYPWPGPRRDPRIYHIAVFRALVFQIAVFQTAAPRIAAFRIAALSNRSPSDHGGATTRTQHLSSAKKGFSHPVAGRRRGYLKYVVRNYIPVVESTILKTNFRGNTKVQQEPYK